MLAVAEDFMVGEVIHHIGYNNVLQHLGAHTGQGDWPVISGFETFSFFVDRGNVGGLPIVWNYATLQGFIK